MLTEQINEDIKTAMRAKETLKVGTLRMLKAAIVTQEGKQPKPLTDAETIALIRTEIKKRHESATAFIKGDRSELAVKELDEIQILSAYLPPALSSEDLEKIVVAAITAAQATSKKDMGKVMKLATAAANNAVDGKTLSQLVQSMLP